MATDRDYLTFPQARARLAETAARELSPAQLIDRLISSGYVVQPADLFTTPRSLAYKLAYRLLPPGPDKGGE